MKIRKNDSNNFQQLKMTKNDLRRQKTTTKVKKYEKTAQNYLFSVPISFLFHFSESIRKELDYDFPEIICQCVQPCVVITNMAPKFVKESIRFPTPETFCKYAVSTIGAVSVTGGYWAHDLLHFLQHIPYKKFRQIMEE